MNIKSFTKMGLAVATFGATAALSGGAYADALINQLFTNLPPLTNQIQDTNVDRICDGACDGTNSVESGTFQTGYVVESLLRFDTVNTTAIADEIGISLPAGYKLFAYSTLAITSIVEAPGSGGNDDGVCETGEVCLAFATPDVQIYEGTTVPSNWQTLTPEAAITSVTSQTLIATFGLDDANDFWFFNFIEGTDPIGAIAALTTADPDQGAYQFGISLITNDGNLPIANNGVLGADGFFHDLVGNGSAKVLPDGTCGAPNGSTCTGDGWLIGTDTTANFLRSSVPEPGSLALLGVALASAGWIRRRRQQS
jgi:hypothetical protein